MTGSRYNVSLSAKIRLRNSLQIKRVDVVFVVALMLIVAGWGFVVFRAPKAWTDIMVGVFYIVGGVAWVVRYRENSALLRWAFPLGAILVGLVQLIVGFTEL